MTSSIFQSQYPILEACMNKGSTLPLAIAVHNAGGYPSFCSWTYNRRADGLQRDLDKFVAATGSNNIHISFELNEPGFDIRTIQNIVKSYKIPTIELIYGNKNTFDQTKSEDELLDDVLELLTPIKANGTTVFKRMYDNVDQDTMDLHLLDGFCIKGLESAGFGTYTPVKDSFLKQRELTPNALLIPYGGVGTAEQVKEYLDLGATMVAVGTLLALSEEGTMSNETKMAAIEMKSADLKQFSHIVGNVERKQTALQFKEYQGNDDKNGTMGLLQGLRGKDKGHVYFGTSIDHVTEILPCKQVIQNLTALI